jgi:ElaB/YqjD/DUF883 family membrane-anchored ribosome-binding protein
METTAGSIPPNGSSGTTPGNGAAASKVDKAASAVHSAIDEAARKAKPAIDRAATLAHDAADKLKGASSQTADWMSEKTETLTATQKKLVEDTCTYVSANPLKSIAMAVAAGYVLSKLLK